MKIEVIDKIERCPKCKELMERRKHKFFTGKQHLNKSYFTEWDACPNCNHIQHYEKYRQPITPEVLKEKGRLGFDF